LEDWMITPFEMSSEAEPCYEICLNSPIDKSTFEKCATCP